MRIAVIDLGTNTFNLLVAEKIAGNRLDFLYSERQPVFLGKKGFHLNLITGEAMKRAWLVLKGYKQTAQRYNVEKIIAIGTSALRTAKNARHFIVEAQNILESRINVISGAEEANLIYLGVRQSLEAVDETFLIVDIGGGSNELILANMESVIWKKSYPIGMARLKERFEISDPITPLEIERLNNFFEFTLTDFLHFVLPRYTVNVLIGAEGSFESFLLMAAHQNCIALPSGKDNLPHCNYLPVVCFDKVKDMLLFSTLKERQKLGGLAPFRAGLIVLAALFVDFILKRLSEPRLLVSAYSLKEGAAWEYFYGHLAVK